MADEQEKNPRHEARKLFLWITGLSVRNASSYLEKGGDADFESAFLHVLNQKRDLIAADRNNWLPDGGFEEFLDLVDALERQVISPTDAKGLYH